MHIGIMKYRLQRALGLMILVLLPLSAAHSATSLKEVQTLANQGKLQQALGKTTELLEADPANIEGRFYRGLLLTKLNQLEQAESVFQSLINDHPDLPEPYNNLAVVYAAQGKYDKARDLLNQAINTHPSYATAHENLGDIYAKMASRAYNHVLELDDNNESAREKLSLISELFSRPEPVQVAAKTPEPEVTAPGPVTQVPEPEVQEAAVPLPETVPEPVPVPEPVVDQSPAILTALDNWAAAWSSQDISAYLSHYSDSYVPPGGLSLSQWKAQREKRLTKPKFIKVKISSAKVTTRGDKQAEVSFTQNYQSDTYSDRVGKNILFTMEDDRWLIAKERSE